MSRHQMLRLQRLESHKTGKQAVHVVRERDGEVDAQIEALKAAGAAANDLFVIIRSFAQDAGR